MDFVCKLYSINTYTGICNGRVSRCCQIESSFTVPPPPQNNLLLTALYRYTLIHRNITDGVEHLFLAINGIHMHLATERMRTPDLRTPASV